VISDHICMQKMAKEKLQYWAIKLTFQLKKVYKLLNNQLETSPYMR